MMVRTEKGAFPILLRIRELAALLYLLGVMVLWAVGSMMIGNALIALLLTLTTGGIIVWAVWKKIAFPPALRLLRVATAFAPGWLWSVRPTSTMETGEVRSVALLVVPGGNTVRATLTCENAPMVASAINAKRATFRKLLRLDKIEVSEDTHGYVVVKYFAKPVDDIRL